MQIKTTMRYHFSYTRTTTIRQIQVLMRLWRNQNLFTLLVRIKNGTLWKTLCPLFPISAPGPSQPLISFLSLCICPFLGIPYKRYHIIHSLCIWLLLYSMFLRFIHVVGYVSTSLLFIATEYPVTRMYHILFIHSLADSHLGCCHCWLLWIIRLWALSTSFCIDICFQFSWAYTEPYDGSMF